MNTKKGINRRVSHSVSNRLPGYYSPSSRARKSMDKESTPSVLDIVKHGVIAPIASQSPTNSATPLYHNTLTYRFNKYSITRSFNKLDFTHTLDIQQDHKWEGQRKESKRQTLPIKDQARIIACCYVVFCCTCNSESCSCAWNAHAFLFVTKDGRRTFYEKGEGMK